MKPTVLTRLPCAIEILESRIAPASFVFTDMDGDVVVVSTNKGSNAQLGAVLKFNTAVPGPQQLEQVALLENPVFRGTNLTITATTPTGGLGDGKVNVGYVNATGMDLGRVSIDGDLGQIDAGDRRFFDGSCLALTVGSMGLSGLTTQGATPGASLETNLFGALGSFRSLGHVRDVLISVSAGGIGSVSITGNLEGGALTRSGSIYANGDIGRITIIGNLQGGAGEDSGSFQARKIGAVSIFGNLLGGTAESSGSINATQLGTINVTGNIVGGDQLLSGSIKSSGRIGKVTVGGDLEGGLGERSGSLASTKAMLAVTIKGNILGGGGFRSGQVASELTIASLTVGDIHDPLNPLRGNIVGGVGIESGAVGSNSPLGAVVLLGSLKGGVGTNSGQIVSKTTIQSVRIEGSILGGDGFQSGAVGSIRSLGPILVKGNVEGGNLFDRSGLITCGGNTASIIIRGSIIGGAAEKSGSIVYNGRLGPVTIGLDLQGGSGADSGCICPEDVSEGQPAGLGLITQVTIGRSIVGGTSVSAGSIQSFSNIGVVSVGQNIEGGSDDFTGSVVSGGKINRITVGGVVKGGTGFQSGAIETDGEGAGGNIGFLRITGGIAGGTGPNSGGVFSTGAIGTAIVGPITGGAGNFSGGLSSELGMTNVIVTGNVTGFSGIAASAVLDSGRISTGGPLQRLTILGSVIGATSTYRSFAGDTEQFGQIFAGGAIGIARITGSLIGGTGNDSAEVRGASIGSITIGSEIHGGSGTLSGTIIAEQTDIGSVKIGNALNLNDGLITAGTGDLAGGIHAERNIGIVEVNKLVGSDFNHVSISAGGRILPRTNLQALTIGSLLVRDSATFVNVLAGYHIGDTDGGIGTLPLNPDAQIGFVTVGAGAGSGNFSGVNLVAGAENNNARFGFVNTFGDSDQPISATSNSAAILSKIAGVVIKGSISGTSDPEDGFGIVAQFIASVKIAGKPVVLKAGPSNDFVTTSALSDVRVDEISIP